jgi:hypothetical protein
MSISRGQPLLYQPRCGPFLSALVVGWTARVEVKFERESTNHEGYHDVSILEDDASRSGDTQQLPLSCI